jgi:hypothetical protein
LLIISQIIFGWQRCAIARVKATGPRRRRESRIVLIIWHAPPIDAATA